MFRDRPRHDGASCPLGLGGNCRTHLSMGNSRAYFYDSKILAHSWAALSTDGSEGYVKLEANNCKVQTILSGYAPMPTAAA